MAPVLNWLDGLGKTQSFESYARVLLEWYKAGKEWIYDTDESEAPVKAMLLEALKQVTDPKLRAEIETTLTNKTDKTGAQTETES